MLGMAAVRSGQTFTTLLIMGEQVSNVAWIHCRPMPLTASGGANAINSSNVDAQHSTGDSGSPAVKKPKGVDKKSAPAKKRGLKRL